MRREALDTRSVESTLLETRIGGPGGPLAALCHPTHYIRVFQRAQLTSCFPKELPEGVILG